jgi:hypothetical protein
MKLKDLRPGDVLVNADDARAPELVVAVDKKAKLFRVLPSGENKLSVYYFSDTQSGKMWIDCLVIRNKKEIFRGWKYDEVRANIARLLCKS